jgi:hypothetical protein
MQDVLQLKEGFSVYFAILPQFRGLFKRLRDCNPVSALYQQWAALTALTLW